MTIPFVQNPGGLFNRIGKIGKMIADVNAYQATTAPADVDGITSQYSADPDLIDGIGGQLLANQNNTGSMLAFLGTMGVNTVNKMVYLDNPQSSNNSLQVSMQEVVRQMIANSQTVQRCNVGMSIATQPGMTGNGVLVGTTKDNNGLNCENQFAEHINITCINDSSNGLTAGNEQFQLMSVVSQPNTLHWQWPVGSGITQNINAINASKNNAQGTLLNNGDFETWTVANNPDNWVIAVGVPGTTVMQSTAQFYTGLSSMQWAGDGATLINMTQQFGVTTGGTSAVLLPVTIYAFSIWLKVDVVPASGVLEVALTDGGGTVLTDQQGVNNSATISAPTLTTTWTNFTAVFRTPRGVPPVHRLRLRMTTPLPTGTNLFLDRAGFAPMQTMYSGGPSFALFSGSLPFHKADQFVVTTTNDRGGSASLKTFQTLFDRLYNMRALGLVLPSSASPTISDSLIN